MITLDPQTKLSTAGTCPGVKMGLCGSETAVRVERCIAYMVQHLDQPLQVATLAAQARVSSSHFFALFKRRIGSAPMDYFTRLRMQRACRLLEDTGFSIKEISSKLGYDDQFYFSRVFKSINGVAPSAYRMQLTENRRRLPTERNKSKDRKSCLSKTSEITRTRDGCHELTDMQRSIAFSIP